MLEVSLQSLAPEFPYDGKVMIIETEADKKTVEEFILNVDPLYKNGLFEECEVVQFEATSRRPFERLAVDFVYRS